MIYAAWPGLLLADRIFVHPGALDSKSSLNSVKARILAGEQPWSREFDLLKNSGAATREPTEQTHISTESDAGIARDDALATYTQALLWYFTGNERYAERAVTNLNTWSVFQAFNLGTDQDKLRAGWIGAVLAPAAEIMRTYKGWNNTGIAALQAMFQRAFYPQLLSASSWNGNVDLTQIDAMMAIAVFNEDETVFNAGLQRLKLRNPAYFYLVSDGERPAEIAGDQGDLEHFWHNPVSWVDGLTQETCRDNGHHSQYALGSALHAAEVAWNQGVDVYSPNQARYTAAMELMASSLLAGSFDSCRETIATANRFNTWEVGYNHYHNRAGLELPYTRQLIVQQIRTNSTRAAWNLVYETLTHAGFADGE